MSEELKACPFCGSPGKYFGDTRQDDFPAVICSNEGCSQNDYFTHDEKWQSRPIEDALRAKLEMAKEKLIELEKFCTDNGIFVGGIVNKITDILITIDPV